MLKTPTLKITPPLTTLHYYTYLVIHTNSVLKEMREKCSIPD